MSFASDMRRIVLKVKARNRAAYVGFATRVHRAIRGTGSPDPVTGAPGQPVDTGFLRNSWTLSVGPTEALIQTKAAYARAIEDGVGPYGPLTLRSKVGGFHSVKLTVAGASRLQADVIRELGP